MNCRRVERNLVSYLYGEISPWKRRRVDRHLERCPACRVLVEQTRVARQLVADLPEIQVPAELTRSVLHKAITPVEESDPVRRSLVLRPAFGFVVVLAVAVGVVLSQTIETPLFDIIPIRDLFPFQSQREVKRRYRDNAGDLAKAPIPREIVGGALQVEKRELDGSPQAALRRIPAAERFRADDDSYQVASTPEPGGGLALAYTRAEPGKADSPAEPSRLAMVANGMVEENGQAAFLNAMETYNKAFQKTGEARRALLRDALKRFEKVAARTREDTWQVLASALCADIHRALGETSTAVDLYKGIVKSAAAYQGYVREARYALFKVRYFDQEDVEAAHREAMAIIEEGTSDARASHVSLLMADRLSEADPRAAAFWYGKAQEICPPNSGGYDRATIALAGLARQMAEENYILDWWVIAPFEDPEHQRLVTKHPPEREIDLSKQYPGANGRLIGWKRLSKTVPPHNASVGELEQEKGFRFHGIIDPDEHVSIYALTYAHVDKKTPVRLLIGSDDSVRCWVNDELVWSNPCIRGLSPDQDAVAATLRKGWNKILLKVANNEGLWGFFFQIVGRRGDLLWDLEVDPDAGEVYKTTRVRRE